MVKPILTKPLIFISHINEEKAIALALKKLLEEGFNGAIQVFVSSSPSCLHLGQKWLDQISNALEKCVVEIIITSHDSISRPWVNFEAGAGWVRKIPVIPLCHSGMTLRSLPSPFSDLMAGMASERDDVEKLLTVLADACNLGVPKVDVSGFIHAVEQYEARIGTNGTVKSLVGAVAP